MQVNSAAVPKTVTTARLAEYRTAYHRLSLQLTEVTARHAWAVTSEDPGIWVQASSIAGEVERLRRGLAHVEARIAGCWREMGR